MLTLTRSGWPAVQHHQRTGGHNAPSSRDYKLRLKRLYRGKDDKGPIWLLHGGRGGGAVNDFANLTYGIADALPDWKFYALDHRGTGGKSGLTCPDELGLEHCAAHLKDSWGKKLEHINTTNSARNLELTIRSVGDSGQVVMWGQSYGTDQVQRVLALFPDLPDAVIIEGISPAGNSLVDYSERFDQVGSYLFERCALVKGVGQRLFELEWHRGRKSYC